METFSALLTFVWRIHRSPVNSPHKCQWRGALMFYLISTWINDWVNNREAGDLRRNLAHYDVIVMIKLSSQFSAMQGTRKTCQTFSTTFPIERRTTLPHNLAQMWWLLFQCSRHGYLSWKLATTATFLKITLRNITIGRHGADWTAFVHAPSRFLKILQNLVDWMTSFKMADEISRYVAALHCLSNNLHTKHHNWKHRYQVAGQSKRTKWVNITVTS